MQESGRDPPSEDAVKDIAFLRRFPEQYTAPFPSFAGPTDTEDWGRADALLWYRECSPGQDELDAVYAEYEDADRGYDYGVEAALSGVGARYS